MPGVNTVTAAIARAGHPEVTLYRGDGYHYYVFDNTYTDPRIKAGQANMVYETESVMVPRLRSLPFDRWVADGIAFAEKIKREKAA